MMRVDDRVSSDENARIAACLRQAAEILAAQGANPFRVGAYRRAADTIAALPHAVRVLFAGEGREGLDALAGVGPVIAAAVAEMLETGRWAMLDRLRGELDPTSLFKTVPGVGPELAQRIHEGLGVETLEGLELACHDGRLGALPGIGPRRAQGIAASLADILAGARVRRRALARREPPVSLLLDVDREYRAQAAAGALPRIAPRRFNETGEAWLPILHARRGSWHLTALFSNTARAHELGRTRDWVVLYFHDDRHPEVQRTVVTETHGHLRGRRVVRGRERDCAAFYRAGTASEAASPPSVAASR